MQEIAGVAVGTGMRPGRVLSVDVLRGVTIAFMILVNDPGDWGHVYGQLDHANWNGWTLTDMVFPSFLFLMGAAVIFSLRGRLAKGEKKGVLALQIVRRSAVLFAIDLFLAGFPHFHLTRLRIYGVMTRIALCYLFTGMICLWTQRARNLAVLCGVFVVGYWILLRFVPVPGYGVPGTDVPVLDKVGNLTSWVDRGVIAWMQRTLHVGRLYRGTSDPEGLLSTIPAVATTLMGALTGLWVQRASAAEPDYRISRTLCCVGLFTAGAVSATAGLIWGQVFSINKNLWTSSFVLFTGGCVLLGLAVCYWAVDVRGLQETRVGRWLLWPWLVFGSNAIAAFVVSELAVEVMLWIKVWDGGKRITAWLWVYRHGFARGESTEVTSLLFALAFTAICFLPNWWLWRRKIFLRV